MGSLAQTRGRNSISLGFKCSIQIPISYACKPSIMCGHSSVTPPHIHALGSSFLSVIANQPSCFLCACGTSLQLSEGLDTQSLNPQTDRAHGLHVAVPIVMRAGNVVAKCLCPLVKPLCVLSVGRSMCTVSHG
eukprot:scaffold78208_cov18-Prasinocladus_malaysianus.AAC.1